MSNLIPYDKPAGIALDATFKRKLADFNETLAAPPGESEIKNHPFIHVEKTVLENGQPVKVKQPLQYLPIEFVEAKLNHYFGGLWQTTSFKYTVIVNEIVGDLELSFWHPEAGVWIRRVGTGAVLIQQRVQYDEQGGKKEQDLLDINRKIANTLVKDMGHLKSECIKNAAKSLGRTFGSDLGRDLEDQGYQDVHLTPEAVEDEIKDIASQEELTLYYSTLPIIARNDKRIRMILKDKQLAVKKKGGKDNG